MKDEITESPKTSAQQLDERILAGESVSPEEMATAVQTDAAAARISALEEERRVKLEKEAEFERVMKLNGELADEFRLFATAADEALEAAETKVVDAILELRKAVDDRYRNIERFRVQKRAINGPLPTEPGNGLTVGGIEVRPIGNHGAWQDYFDRILQRGRQAIGVWEDGERR